MNRLDRTHKNRKPKSRKKSTKLTDDKLSLICTVLSALCGYLTGGFTVLVSKDGTPAVICAIMFTALMILFVVLSYSYHIDSIRKIRNQEYKKMINRWE